MKHHNSTHKPTCWCKYLATASIAIAFWHLYLRSSPLGMHSCLYVAGSDSDPAFTTNIHWVTTNHPVSYSVHAPHYHSKFTTPFSKFTHFNQNELETHTFDHHRLLQPPIISQYCLFPYSRSFIVELHISDLDLTSAYSPALFSYDRS